MLTQLKQTFNKLEVHLESADLCQGQMPYLAMLTKVNVICVSTPCVKSTPKLNGFVPGPCYTLPPSFTTIESVVFRYPADKQTELKT